MVNRPQKMNISVMRQILSETKINDERHFFISEDFGIGYATNTIFQKVLGDIIAAPFIVEDYRIGLILEGEIDVNLNLIHHRFTAGDIIYIGRSSIAHINSVSKDLNVRGFIISSNMMNKIFGEKTPDFIDGTVLSHIFHSTQQDREIFTDLNNTVWHLIHYKPYSEDTLHSLLAAVINYLNHLYHLSLNSEPSPDGMNHSHDIFNRFISLVNKFAKEERSISFYADKMCLSPRYLSTVVGHYSGKTCKEWIDQATINHAKVMLIHTQKSISQIAYALKFPNDSFFCKYFRRLTGKSPTQYRNPESSCE